MRISDWSADVCAADRDDHPDLTAAGGHADPDLAERGVEDAGPVPGRSHEVVVDLAHVAGHADVLAGRRPADDAPSGEGGAQVGVVAQAVLTGHLGRPLASGLGDARSRSEEHTSELQSLMRISYAVFCLNKKKTTRNTTTQISKT